MTQDPRQSFLEAVKRWKAGQAGQAEASQADEVGADYLNAEMAVCGLL